MAKNLQKNLIPFFIIMLEISLLCYCVFALETNQNLSAIISKEVELGEGIKFDMFLRSSVTFEYPEKVEAGENINGTFFFNPATVMIFLDIPSINQTYATETEIPLEDSKPITVFDGVIFVIDLQPTTKLSASGPIEFNQSKIIWENFLQKQSYQASVFVNATREEKIDINSEFYLNTKISVNIQLQDYTKEISGFPIPQMEMLPKISHSVQIESTASIPDALGNPINLLAIALTATLIVTTFILTTKYKHKKAEKQIPPTKTKKVETIERNQLSETNESSIFCIYCGEKLPAEAIFCKKCGKKIK